MPSAPSHDPMFTQPAASREEFVGRLNTIVGIIKPGNSNVLLNDKLTATQKWELRWVVKVLLDPVCRLFGYDIFSDVKVKRVVQRFEEYLQANQQYCATTEDLREISGISDQILTRLKVKTSHKHDKVLNLALGVLNDRLGRQERANTEAARLAALAVEQDQRQRAFEAQQGILEAQRLALTAEQDQRQRAFEAQQGVLEAQRLALAAEQDQRQRAFEVLQRGLEAQQANLAAEQQQRQRAFDAFQAAFVQEQQQRQMAFEGQQVNLAAEQQRRQEVFEAEQVIFLREQQRAFEEQRQVWQIESEDRKSAWDREQSHRQRMFGEQWSEGWRIVHQQQQEVFKTWTAEHEHQQHVFLEQLKTTWKTALDQSQVRRSVPGLTNGFGRSCNRDRTVHLTPRAPSSAKKTLFPKTPGISPIPHIRTRIEESQVLEDEEFTVRNDLLIEMFMALSSITQFIQASKEGDRRGEVLDCFGVVTLNGMLIEMYGMVGQIRQSDHNDATLDRMLEVASNMLGYVIEQREKIPQKSEILNGSQGIPIDSDGEEKEPLLVEEGKMLLNGHFSDSSSDSNGEGEKAPRVEVGRLNGLHARNESKLEETSEVLSVSRVSSLSDMVYEMCQLVLEINECIRPNHETSIFEREYQTHGDDTHNKTFVESHSFVCPEGRVELALSKAAFSVKRILELGENRANGNRTRSDISSSQLFTRTPVKVPAKRELD